MKKTVVATLVLSFAVASIASATTTFTSTAGPSPAVTNTNVNAFRTSAQVTLVADGDTAGYNVASGHAQGNLIYQSASTSAVIDSTNATPGSVDVGASVPTTYTAGGGASSP